jgi:aryl-alcohol dehydrogenase-like predicted oxidoreductase
MRTVIVPAKRCRVGRSAVSIGPLGFGGNALSNLYAAVDEAEALAAVRAAYAGGVRFFDTAPLYGHGLGEHRLGSALRVFPRDSFVLSTKVGRLLRPHGRNPPSKPSPRQGGIFVDELPFEPIFDYSAAAIRVWEPIGSTSLSSTTSIAGRMARRMNSGSPKSSRRRCPRCGRPRRRA